MAEETFIVWVSLTWHVSISAALAWHSGATRAGLGAFVEGAALHTSPEAMSAVPKLSA